MGHESMEAHNAGVSRTAARRVHGMLAKSSVGRAPSQPFKIRPGSPFISDGGDK